MKILIVRFSSIGDIVLTTPVVGAIHQQIDGVCIHYLTKKQFVPLLVNHPKIKKIYAFNQSLNEIIQDLKNEHYDFLLDLHNNIRTFTLKRKMNIQHRSFRKLNIQKWLLVNFHYHNMPKLHVVDRYFEAVHQIGVRNDFRSCELFLSAQDHIDTTQRWQLAPKNYIAVAIGAQFATKTMPISILIEILQSVNYPIILLGGKDDTKRSEQLIDGLKKHPNTIINAVNRFSLLQSASIVAQAKVLLTHDTGLMHIATAFDTPIVSVWGNTVPALGMYPYLPNNPERFSIHEVQQLACRPCSKIGHASCPKKHFKCMHLQDPQEISNAIQRRVF